MPIITVLVVTDSGTVTDSLTGVSMVTDPLVTAGVTIVTLISDGSSVVVVEAMVIGSLLAAGEVAGSSA